jgi:hypothetical protein
MYMTMRKAVMASVVSLEAMPSIRVSPSIRSAAMSRMSTTGFPPMAVKKSLKIPLATKSTKLEGDTPSMAPWPEGVAYPRPSSLSKKGHSISHPIAMRNAARMHSPFSLLSIDLKSMIGRVGASLK